MGSSNSKVIASAGEVGPGRIGPFLLRKFEEFKKCGRKTTTTIPRESTLSIKKLLKEDDDVKSNSSIEIEAVYKVAKVVPLPDTEQTSQEEWKDCEDKMDNSEKEDEEVDEKNNDENNDDDDDDVVDIERLICPSSPSFRIYCIPYQECKEETETEIEIECFSVKSNQSKSQEMHIHQKSSSEDSVSSIHSVASSTTAKISNECVERDSRTKRKGSKKRFRAMRKLIKVKALYPSCACAAGSDEVKPIRAKSAK